MKRAALALALATFASSARAQVADEVPPSIEPVEAAARITGPVVSVVIEPPVEGEDAWQRTGLSPGIPFTAGRAREALRHALASGTFAAATISARALENGVEVVLRGERRYRLVSIEIRGASARDAELVREDADLHGDMAVTEATVNEALRRIAGAYRDAGFPNAQARAEWRETGTPGARELTLRVTEGQASRVRAVEIAHAPGGLEASARGAVGLSTGDLAGPVRVRVGEESLTTHLRREGYLDARVTSSVETLPQGGVRVRYEVTPGDHYVMEWLGAHAMPDESLVESLRLGEEQGFTEATLSSFSSRVQDFYARRAWYDARVRATVAPAHGGTRVLRFSVSEQRQVYVRQMTFPGATVLTGDELRAMVEEAGRSELPSTPRMYRGRIWRERTYTPGVYSTAVQHIVDAYRERGYLDAAVEVRTPVRVDTPDGPRFDIELRVTEGPRSYVEELVFDGNLAQPSASLAEVWALRLGVALSYRDVSEARVRLGDWYRERGFAFARIEPEIERSPDHTRVRVRVVVHEGPRVRVSRVEVRGNNVARTSVVLSRLALREGDTFSLSALRASQRQLYELGIFTSVNVGLDDGDIEAPVKTLLVRVVEDRRVGLEARVGFSLGQGARVGLEFSYLDIGGLAMNLSVRPELGYLLPIELVAPTPDVSFHIDDWDTQRFNWRLPVSLAFPYLPGLGPHFRASIDGVVSRVVQPWALALTTYGIGGTLSWRPVQRLSLSWTTELQRINVEAFGASTIQGSIIADCVRSGTRPGMTMMQTQDLAESCRARSIAAVQPYLRYAPGLSDLAALRLGIVWDGRDNPLTPTRGTYASLTSELLFLLGFQGEGAASRPSDITAHFEARVTGYVPIPLAGMVLALSARGGRNVALAGNENTHPSRLFWLGGAGSMRGWIQNQLVPQDTINSVLRTDPAHRDDVLASARGGEFFLNFVADLRVPTGWCPSSGTCLEFGVFADFGNVWQQIFDDWWRLRFSPGAGLRLTSPVGIIAFDVGFVPFYYPTAHENWVQTVQFYLGNTL